MFKKILRLISLLVGLYFGIIFVHALITCPEYKEILHNFLDFLFLALIIIPTALLFAWAWEED